MTRLVLALALFAITTDAAWGQKRPIQLGEQPYPGPRPQPAQPDLQVPADTNPDPKSLEYGDAELSKARTLARQLGSKEYKERELASRELGKIGRAAVVAIREIRATETNPEVRLRTDILLPRAESDDMRARVMCFLADKDGKFDHKLPGWAKFKDTAGSDKAARELFAEVLKKAEYHAMLLACEMSANDLSQVLTTYYQAVQQKQNLGQNVQFTAAELAVLAFLECQYSDKALRVQGMWGQASVGQYLYIQDIQNAMRNGSGKFGDPLRRIVGKWMDTRETAFGIQQVMNLAQNWQMKDFLKYSARMFAVDDPNYQWAKAQAATQIAQKHNEKDGKEEVKQYLPLMVKGLDDGALLTQMFVGNGRKPNEMIAVNTQDYILGLLCQMTDQKPADYGMDAQANGPNNFQNYAQFYFKDSDKQKAGDKRDAGIKKFKAWAEKNIKAEPPKKGDPKKDDAPKKKDDKKDDEPKKNAPVPQPPVAPRPIKK